ALPTLPSFPTRRSSDLDGFLFAVERRDVGAGAENLLAHGARGLRQSGPERRLDPGAAVARIAESRHASAGDDLRALLPCELVIRSEEHTSELQSRSDLV